MDDKILYLETLRKKVVTILICIIAVSIFISLVCLFTITPRFSNNIGYYISLFIGVGVGFLLVFVTDYCNRLEAFKKLFKSTFVEVPFREAFPPIIYDSEQGFDSEIINNTGMMRLGNRYYSNDYLQGFYKNVKFERADVKIQQHVSTGKSSYTITYFNGRWLIFEFNKEFHFDLQIIDKDFSNSQKKNSIFTGEDEYRHRIKMEDIAFNETFLVYGQDDHEAFYILTPQFMEVLEDMYQNMDGAFMLGFVDNQLHVAINTEKDAMEPSIFSCIEDLPIETEVQREINAIMSLIDGLSLDNVIYKNKQGGQ